MRTIDQIQTDISANKSCIDEYYRDLSFNHDPRIPGDSGYTGDPNRAALRKLIKALERELEDAEIEQTLYVRDPERDEPNGCWDIPAYRELTDEDILANPRVKKLIQDATLNELHKLEKA